MANRPWPSLLDGIGSGIGYALVLVIVGFFRELLGSGTCQGAGGAAVLHYDAGYVNNGLMILPPDGSDSSGLHNLDPPFEQQGSSGTLNDVIEESPTHYKTVWKTSISSYARYSSTI